MHIHKLVHHRNHIREQNRSDPRIITLNNHINKQIYEHKTKPGNNILTKLITNTIHLRVEHHSKTIKQKTLTQQNRSIRFGTKTAIPDIDKAKAFNKQSTNVTLYSTKKSTGFRPYNQDPSCKENTYNLPLHECN